MRRAWLLAAGFAALGCSSLLGLDEFEDAPTGTGGAAGSAASGGGGATGGVAGTGAAPIGGAPQGGAGGSGGTVPTGGGPSGGAGGAAGIGGAGGTGGTGGKYVCTQNGPIPIATQDYVPGANPPLVLASDDDPTNPTVHVLISNVWTANPPFGRFPHEVVAFRVNGMGSLVGPLQLAFDMQGSPFRLALAHVRSSPTPGEVVVLGHRGSVERWGFKLDASLSYQIPQTPDLKTLLPQTQCLQAGPNGFVETAAFTYEDNDERWAATCVDLTLKQRVLWAGTQAAQVSVLTKDYSDDSLIPRGYWAPKSSSGGWRILWQNNDGFRRGEKEGDLAVPEAYLPNAGMQETKVLAMSRRQGGVVLFLQRTDSGGNQKVSVAQLLEPYDKVATAAIQDIGGPFPPPQSLSGGEGASTLRALAGPAGPPTGTGTIRVVIYDEANGNVIFVGDVFQAKMSVKTASAVSMGSGKVLVAWLDGDGVLMGGVLSCGWQ